VSASKTIEQTVAGLKQLVAAKKQNTTSNIQASDAEN